MERSSLEIFTKVVLIGQKVSFIFLSKIFFLKTKKRGNRFRVNQFVEIDFEQIDLPKTITHPMNNESSLIFEMICIIFM